MVTETDNLIKVSTFALLAEKSEQTFYKLIYCDKVKPLKIDGIACIDKVKYKDLLK